MKTIKLFFTVFLLFALKTTIAQEPWHEHYVMDFGNPPIRPNINSISIINHNTLFSGITCGDSGYIARWEEFWGSDYWNPNDSLISNKNLYSCFDIDSMSEIKAFIVGEDGIILKTNIIPFIIGNIPFYFQTSPTTQNLYSVYFYNYVTGIAVGDAGTIIKTTDGGSHWNLISSITLSRLYSVQLTSANIGYAVGVNGTVIKTTNGGESWVIKSQPIADTLRCVWFTDDNVGFVVSRNGAILKTTDGGNNWQSKPSGIIQNLNAIRFATPSLGYAAGNDNKLLRTTDAGETWTLQTMPTLTNQGHFKGIGIGTTSPNVNVIGSNGTAIGNFPEGGSIQENLNKSSVIITPNPAKDYININTGLYENLLLQIFNTQGQRVCNKTLLLGLSQLNISNYKSGFYFYKVINNKGKVFGKGSFVKMDN